MEHTAATDTARIPAVDELHTGSGTTSGPLLGRVAAMEAEAANRLTHGVGFVFAVFGSAHLLQSALQSGSRRQFAACAIYAVAICSLFLMSTLSHTFSRPALRHMFRTLDQISIFLLIAATWTPLWVTGLFDGWWIVSLIATWILAAVGIATKLFVTRRENVPLWLFVATALVPVLTSTRAVELLPGQCVALIVAGGLSYSVGLWFYVNDERHRLYHAIWHVMVIVGCGCHYMVNLNYSTPASQATLATAALGSF